MRSDSELGRGDRHDDGNNSAQGFHGLTLTLLAATILGAVLRLPGQISRPLWLDEALQADISTATTVGEVLSRSASLDLHPPGFALAAHAATQVFGPAEWALRSPSLLAGLLTVPLAWAAGRAWGDRQLATTLALAAAVCPPWVAYAREARPYAGAIAWVLALLWAAGVHRKSPSPLSSVALTVCAVGGLFWQYTAGLVALGILGALATQRLDRGVIVSLSATAVTGVGLAAGLLRHQLSERADVAGHLDLSLLTGPFELVGYCAVGSWSWSALLGLLLLPLVVRKVPRDVALVALLPTIALYGLAVVGLHPFGGIRQCLVLTPGLLLAAAHYRFGLDRLLPVGLMAAVAVQIWRFPGVPVWDVPALIAKMDGATPIWVDPRLGRSWVRYGGMQATIASWGETEIPAQPQVWIVTLEDGLTPEWGRATRVVAAQGVTATLWKPRDGVE